MEIVNDNGKLSARIHDLAHSLDCFTEDDLCVLYKITPGTAEAWRKRRQGPAYVLAGNRYLYPRAGMVADLESKLREPHPVPTGEL